MYNLLPTIERKKLEREYNLRIATTFFWFLFFTGFAGMIFLLPAFLMAKVKNTDVMGKHKSLKEILELKEKNDNVANIFKEIKEQSDFLSTDGNQIFQTELIEKVVDKKTRSIRLMAFTHSHAGDGIGRLVVSGVASNRESLVTFVESLKEEELFSKVDLPVSNLAKSSNIDFSVTIEGKF